MCGPHQDNASAAAFASGQSQILSMRPSLSSAFLSASRKCELKAGKQQPRCLVKAEQQPMCPARLVIQLSLAFVSSCCGANEAVASPRLSITHVGLLGWPHRLIVKNLV